MCTYIFWMVVKRTLPRLYDFVGLIGSVLMTYCMCVNPAYLRACASECEHVCVARRPYDKWLPGWLKRTLSLRNEHRRSISHCLWGTSGASAAKVPVIFPIPTDVDQLGSILSGKVLSRLENKKHITESLSYRRWYEGLFAYLSKVIVLMFRNQCKYD